MLPINDPTQNAVLLHASWVDTMNALARDGIPYLFLLDFELNKPFICKLSDIKEDIFYEFSIYKKVPEPERQDKILEFKATPIERTQFETAFREVVRQQHLGNSYLLNLTFPAKLNTNYSLTELFHIARAKYKLFFRDEFIVFSPETFVTVREGLIRTNPMKGTINARMPDAKNRILHDPKETAEHNTIVDLMRNDLSRVAKNVTVSRYRYIDQIDTRHGSLLQVSSEITGTLTDFYRQHPGDLFAQILPAGSISGAPKEKTIAIIRENELGPRGYYTGIFGIFDGESIDSAVMIRYIEKQGTQLVYRSGGGITAYSDSESEYNELIEKIYVPAG